MQKTVTSAHTSNQARVVDTAEKSEGQERLIQIFERSSKSKGAGINSEEEFKEMYRKIAQVVKKKLDDTQPQKGPSNDSGNWKISCSFSLFCVLHDEKWRAMNQINNYVQRIKYQ